MNKGRAFVLATLLVALLAGLGAWWFGLRPVMQSLVYGALSVAFFPVCCISRGCFSYS